MAGKAARSKGQRGERCVSKIINDALGVNISRNLSQTRDGGWDLKVEHDEQTFIIEVKAQESLRINDWLAQVDSVVHDDEMPVLAFRRSREPWRVVLRLDDFLMLLSEACPCCGSRRIGPGLTTPYVDPDGTSYPAKPCRRCLRCNALFHPN